MQPLENSDGSSYFQLTVRDPREPACKVLCSVNGPLEAKVVDEIPTRATLEIVIRPHIGVPSIREALMQDQLHTCVSSIVIHEAIPRTLLQVVVQVLESGEKSTQSVNELAASVNAASIALSNAGVPLTGICIAVSSAFIDGELTVSPSGSELEEAKSTHLVVFKYTQSEEGPEARVVHAASTGNFTKNEFLEAVTLSQDASRDVYLKVREQIETDYKDATKWTE